MVQKQMSEEYEEIVWGDSVIFSFSFCIYKICMATRARARANIGNYRGRTAAKQREEMLTQPELTHNRRGCGGVGDGELEVI